MEEPNIYVRASLAALFATAFTLIIGYVPETAPLNKDGKRPNVAEIVCIFVGKTLERILPDFVISFVETYPWTTAWCVFCINGYLAIGPRNLRGLGLFFFYMIFDKLCALHRALRPLARANPLF